MSVGGAGGSNGSRGSSGASSAGRSAAAGAANAAGKAASGIAGALGGIGKALGGIGKAVGGLANGISGIAGKIGSALSQVSGLVDKAMSAITGPLKGMIGNLLDKLPFGIGQLAKPFADKFIDNGLAMVAGGPLGGVASMFGKAGTVGKLADMVDTVRTGAKAVGDIAEGRFNAQQMAAFAQAQLMRGQ